ncbi:hypothetical protein DLM86_29845 [Paenibacillus flagellatus]|uniref:Uncharacterized protein n=1 Tax=Paenibacillus flagellatus TaxID=2211139 RepID=A0A2V5KIY6_9BACL|nr:hypothetical protein DLM86_29845 [Paenibacillus flagellatus]
MVYQKQLKTAEMPFFCIMNSIRCKQFTSLNKEDLVFLAAVQADKWGDRIMLSEIARVCQEFSYYEVSQLNLVNLFLIIIAVAGENDQELGRMSPLHKLLTRYCANHD